MKTKTSTPMERYRAAKAIEPPSLVLVRCGDFYEMFFDDAKTAAGALGLCLTKRIVDGVSVPMAGFPYHQLDIYRAKLVASVGPVAVVEPA